MVMKKITKSSATRAPSMDAACERKCMMKGIGLLALRLAFVLLMLHGIQKLTNISATAQFMGSLGIPAPEMAAWASALVETFGSLLLVLGLFSEYAGILVAFNMFVAFVTAHLPAVLKEGLPMGALKAELPVLYLLAAIAIWYIGPGKFSLKHYLGWGCSGMCKKN